MYKGIMKPLGPHSRRNVIDRLDKRTHTGRFLKKKKAEFTQLVGGNPTFIQNELIERAANLALLLKLADAKVADGVEMSEITARTYQGWCGAYAKMLLRLNITPPDAPGPDAPEKLQQYISMKTEIEAETLENGTPS